MLENIGEAISHEAQKQHERSKAKIDNPTKAVELVKAIITSHVIRGNDAKLLALPKGHETEVGDQLSGAKATLSEASEKARTAALGLPAECFAQLLLQYGEIVEDGEASESKGGSTTKGKGK